MTPTKCPTCGLVKITREEVAEIKRRFEGAIPPPSAVGFFSAGVDACATHFGKSDLVPLEEEGVRIILVQEFYKTGTREQMFDNQAKAICEKFGAGADGVNGASHKRPDKEECNPARPSLSREELIDIIYPIIGVYSIKSVKKAENLSNLLADALLAKWEGKQ